MIATCGSDTFYDEADVETSRGGVWKVEATSRFWARNPCLKLFFVSNGPGPGAYIMYAAHLQVIQFLMCFPPFAHSNLTSSFPYPLPLIFAGVPLFTPVPKRTFFSILLMVQPDTQQQQGKEN